MGSLVKFYFAFVRGFVRLRKRKFELGFERQIKINQSNKNQ